MAKSPSITLTPVEHELISLKIIVDTLNNMINREVLDLWGEEEVEIRFQSFTHLKYFNIILLDFLSEIDADLIGEKKSGIEILQDICKKPHFNNNSISSLEKSTKTFYQWISEEITTWFPLKQKDVEIKIKRKDFIKICGNISKHHFGRLTRQSAKIIEIFKKNNIDISLQDSIGSLESFNERFQQDILCYLSSYLVEMLNNIRWGIHDYLIPEFENSNKKIITEKVYYTYSFPKGVVSEIGKSCYWELMNDIRNKPYVNRFVVPEILKKRY